jgi:hypothetical protein
MINKSISTVNLILMTAVLLLLMAIPAVMLVRPAAINLPAIVTKKAALPKGAFVMEKKAYDAIGAPLMSLKATCPTMRLPDLNKHIGYHGTNGRPDAAPGTTLLYFSLAGKPPVAMAPGESLYIAYDKQQVPARYVFSPNNEKTPLWITASRHDNQAVVYVGMENENGEVISCPESHAMFAVLEREYARTGAGANWEIGNKWKVDGTILARQHARWFGADLFLERHGGEEYEHVLGKQRVDFGQGEELYSCFLGTGDVLVWEEDRWQVVPMGERSLGKPLMHVKKIDERLITFELWDVDGKAKIALNLLKSNENWNGENLERDFRFVGARTRSQCVFEVDDERMLLRPQDWLLLTDDGWKKLTTAEEIDDYVNRKNPGVLFVFDGIAKKNDGQVLVGTLFNPARTDLKTIELAVQQSNVTLAPQTDLDDDEDDLFESKPLLPIASKTRNNEDID